MNSQKCFIKPANKGSVLVILDVKDYLKMDKTVALITGILLPKIRKRPTCYLKDQQC